MLVDSSEEDDEHVTKKVKMKENELWKMENVI
jgi:hypothetical protein